MTMFRNKNNLKITNRNLLGQFCCNFVNFGFFSNINSCFKCSFLLVSRNFSNRSEEGPSNEGFFFHQENTQIGFVILGMPISKTDFRRLFYVFSSKDFGCFSAVVLKKICVSLYINMHGVGTKDKIIDCLFKYFDRVANQRNYPWMATLYNLKELSTVSFDYLKDLAKNRDCIFPKKFTQQELMKRINLYLTARVHPIYQYHWVRFDLLFKKKGANFSVLGNVFVSDDLFFKPFNLLEPGHSLNVTDFPVIKDSVIHEGYFFGEQLDILHKIFSRFLVLYFDYSRGFRCIKVTRNFLNLFEALFDFQEDQFLRDPLFKKKKFCKKKYLKILEQKNFAFSNNQEVIINGKKKVQTGICIKKMVAGKKGTFNNFVSFGPDCFQQFNVNELREICKSLHLNKHSAKTRKPLLNCLSKYFEAVASGLNHLQLSEMYNFKELSKLSRKELKKLGKSYNCVVPSKKLISDEDLRKRIHFFLVGSIFPVYEFPENELEFSLEIRKNRFYLLAKLAKNPDVKDTPEMKNYVVCNTYIFPETRRSLLKTLFARIFYFSYINETKSNLRIDYINLYYFLREFFQALTESEQNNMFSLSEKKKRQKSLKS